MSAIRNVCIIGASGKLGQYMVEQCLGLGYNVVAVCRPESVHKLERFATRIGIVPGMTNDRAVIQEAVAGCDGVLTVLAPWGVQQYSSGTTQAVLDFAEPHAHLAFSCGWHISMDGQDRYSWKIRAIMGLLAPILKLLGVVELSDQAVACELIFSSPRPWTVVRGSDLEEGPSEGLPRWAEHVGDPLLESNRTRRIDFAKFMVHSLVEPSLVRKAPAIVSCAAPSALAAPRLSQAAQLAV